MITLANVRDWLKGFAGAEHYYIGKLDAKQEKSVGVYVRSRSGPPRTALGGLPQTGYDEKAVSVLIHWNSNARETEAAAAALFEHLRALGQTTIAGVNVYQVALDVPEPQDVGTDDNGIYERVIWFTLRYERT